MAKTREERMTAMLETCLGDYEAALADVLFLQKLPDTDYPQRMELRVKEDFITRRISQIHAAWDMDD